MNLRVNLSGLEQPADFGFSERAKLRIIVIKVPISHWPILARHRRRLPSPSKSFSAFGFFHLNFAGNIFLQLSWRFTRNNRSKGRVIANARPSFLALFPNEMSPSEFALHNAMVNIGRTQRPDVPTTAVDCHKPLRCWVISEADSIGVFHLIILSIFDAFR
jgi:hypothetical protein